MRGPSAVDRHRPGGETQDEKAAAKKREQEDAGHEIAGRPGETEQIGAAFSAEAKRGLSPPPLTMPAPRSAPRAIPQDASPTARGLSNAS